MGGVVVERINRKNLPKLIGLVGRSGTGKDRFYHIHLAQFGYARVAFADPVRVLSVIFLLRSYPGIRKTNDILRVFPGIYRELFQFEKSPLSRTLQQYVGTDVARSYREDYWVEITKHIILSYLNNGVKVAVTDVRFPNEARMIRSLGGFLVKMSGQGRYSPKDLLSDHPSEKEVDDLPYDLNEEDFIKYILYYNDEDFDEGIFTKEGDEKNGGKEGGNG